MDNEQIMKLKTSNNEKALKLVKDSFKQISSIEISEDNRLIIQGPIDEMAGILLLIQRSGITVHEVFVCG